MRSRWLDWRGWEKSRIGLTVSAGDSTLGRLAKAGRWFAALIARASVLGSFAVGLATALLAAIGAFPTPGLFRDRESKSGGGD
jgi:hypothetical protein